MSRDGGLPSRVWRGITGREVDRELGARVTYSGVSVKRFVRRVKRAVNRAPRDADVSFHTASLPAIPSRPGLRLDARRLRASVESALDSIGGGRSVRGHVKVVQPKVTTADLADKYPQVVTVDRANFQLRLFKDLKLVEDVQDRGGPGRPRDPCRRLPRAEQGHRPGLARPEQRLGRRPGRQGDSRRSAREPAQVALAGDLRRRRHPRHAMRSPRSARRHRTAASAWRCRTSRSCTTRCRCRRPSTSSSPSQSASPGPARISSTVTSCHPWLSKEAWRSPCRIHRVPIHAARSRPRTCLRRTE